MLTLPKRQASLQGCFVETPHTDAIRAITGIPCDRPGLVNLFEGGTWLFSGATVDNGDGTATVGPSPGNENVYQTIASQLLPNHTYRMAWTVLSHNQSNNNIMSFGANEFSPQFNGVGRFQFDVAITALTQAFVGFRALTTSECVVRYDDAILYDLGPHSAFVVVPGTAGFLFGYRPPDHPTNSFGAISPLTWKNERIYQLTANSSNNIVVLDFGLNGAVQPDNLNNLSLTINAVNRTLTWTGARYEITDAALAAELINRVGLGTDVVILPA